MRKQTHKGLTALLVGTTISVVLAGCAFKPPARQSHAEPARQGAYKAVFSNCTSASSKTSSMIHSMTIQIPEGEQALYAATVSYSEGDTVSLKFGDAELFSMGTDVYRVCGSNVEGNFEVGIYTLRVTVNPVQQLLLVDITLPDGGVLRRGSYKLLGGDTFCWYGTREDAVTEADVQYTAVTSTEYEVSQSEVISDAFSTKVYNLVTSFDDAGTTRLFSWTAREDFVKNTNGMALQYRVKGKTRWKQVKARQLSEASANGQESYFKADLWGLQANTEYEYRIGLRGKKAAGNWSEIYTFKTAPEQIDSFRFIAIGDTQSKSWADGYTYCRAALEQAYLDAPNAAFMLHTGDVTEWGSDANMWKWYFNAIGEHSPTLPHFAAVGNHDIWTDDSNNYFALHFNHPDNGADALDASITERITASYLRASVSNPEDTVYSYDYGNVHFIVLNSGAYVAQDEYLLEAQRRWLISDLEENRDAPWKIVMVHEPVYHRAGGTESRPWLYDVIEGYGVDLVIQGHSHLVTRTYPMRNGEIVTKTSPDLIQQGMGTVYTTIGSIALSHESAGSNTVEECMLISTPEARQPTYTVISVEKDRLTMTVKQLNGLVMDEFTILANPVSGRSRIVAAPEETGCGSTLTASAVVSSTILATAVIVIARSKDDDSEA